MTADYKPRTFQFKYFWGLLIFWTGLKHFHGFLKHAMISVNKKHTELTHVYMYCNHQQLVINSYSVVCVCVSYNPGQHWQSDWQLTHYPGWRLPWNKGHRMNLLMLLSTDSMKTKKTAHTRKPSKFKQSIKTLTRIVQQKMSLIHNKTLQIQINWNCIGLQKLSCFF